MKKDSSRLTVLVITLGFTILYYLSSYRWAIISAILIGVLGVFSTYISNKIELLWFKLSKLLSWLISTIILTLVFYFILFPVSRLARIFSNDPFMLSNKYKSYFIFKERELKKEDFEKTW